MSVPQETERYFNCGVFPDPVVTARFLARCGYVSLSINKDHPLANKQGRVYEHRLVYQLATGVKLSATEHVHHIDGDRLNNRLDNLEYVVNNAEHKVKHRKKDLGLRLPGEPNPVISCACGCGGEFPKFAPNNHPREYLPTHQRRTAHLQNRVLTVLQSSPVQRSLIVAETGLSYKSVTNALGLLRQRGLAQVVKRGFWVKSSPEEVNHANR